jgi:hypothetical protein
MFCGRVITIAFGTGTRGLSFFIVISSLDVAEGADGFFQWAVFPINGFDLDTELTIRHKADWSGSLLVEMKPAAGRCKLPSRQPERSAQNGWRQRAHMLCCRSNQ